MDAAIAQLMAYCQADPVFFESPGRIADRDSWFSVIRRPRRLPKGWMASESDLWVQLHPPGVTLPEQGWKIHISATLADADTVSSLVVDYCLDRNLTVKYLRSAAALRLLNSKYADRSSSGKLLALYPIDERELSEVLPALAELLRGFTGPYILTDLRFEDSPVYVRYGAFRRMTYTEVNGNLVHAVRAPDGGLVPDDRSPAFTVPEWVRVPDVLRPSLDRQDADGEFPFEVERPLHFSNGGGVYLARRRNSGPYVVLLEARPHAGLDATGRDAVARLQRERGFLERLDELDCVPRLLDYLVIWEHHFLVEEYIEGTTLMEEVFDRYPLAGPDASEESLAAYTQWAIETLAKVDHALMAVHARGARFGDLHPANIIVRPDGRIVLVDFEIATDLDDTAPTGLAAPGFTAPAGLTGRAADQYALNCLRQWMFLPITPLQDRDPVKRASLTRVITEHFPVPPTFGSRMVRQFAIGRGEAGEDAPARMFDEPCWPDLRDSMVAGILASATPDRIDRLFPSDPPQDPRSRLSVAYGAAGVLWALHQVGAAVPAEYVNWLVVGSHMPERPRPGLLTGLHGVAATLDVLGYRDEGLDILEWARVPHQELLAPGLDAGLAGVGLVLLHFAEATGEEKLRTEALDIGARLATKLDDLTELRVGLQHGLTGVAQFFLRLYDATGETRHLDAAAHALRRELDRGQTLPDGTFQLLDANRYLTYLGGGSIGLALVLAQYLDRTRRLGRPDAPGFVAAIDGARHSCRAPFVRHPFLFMGRAGTIAALSLLGRPQDRSTIHEHIRRLSWHALSYQGHLAFPGNQLLRLSMDLATGSAGVLVALGVAFGQNASVIPILDLRSETALELEAERR